MVKEGIMKRKIKMSMLAMAAVAAVSCSSEINPVDAVPERGSDLTEMIFTATGEECGSDDMNTKAVFYEYPKIAWQEGDEISVLGKTTGNQKFVATLSSHKTAFEGRADLSDEIYHAVYPYDDAVTLNQDGTLSGVTVPAVQTATAGSFDPEAYIAVAQSEDKETLPFRAVGAFVKFSFRNFDDAVIRSVILKTNGTQVMAGTASSTKVNADGSTSHGNILPETASGNVRLQGTFDTDMSYFMIVRPSTYSEGVTVFIELEDGTVLSRKGKSPLFESGKSRNYIRTMILDRNYFKEASQLYDLYDMGYDIKVGDIVIDKETFGEATLITSESAGKGIGKSGIYFVDSDVTATFNSGITGKLVVIGNGESRATVSRSGVSYLSSSEGDDLLLLKNIKYTDCTDNLFQLNTAYIFESVVFDDCMFDVSTDKNLLLYSTSANTINEFRMTDCDVRMAGTVSLVRMGEYKIDKIEFRNNVMYADEEMASFFAVYSSATVNSVIFNNNTLYNTTIGTSSASEDAVIKAYKSSSFQVTGNYLVNANSTANRYLGRAIFLGGEVDRNFYVRKEETATSIYGVPGASRPSWVISQPEVKAAPADLTAGWDPANGKFVLGGFAGVGAER